MLTFSLSHDALRVFESFGQLSVLVKHCVIVLTYWLVFGLGFHTLLLQYFSPCLKTIDLALKLHQFSVLLLDYSLTGFHLFNELLYQKFIPQCDLFQPWRECFTTCLLKIQSSWPLSITISIHWYSLPIATPICQLIAICDFFSLLGVWSIE